MAGAPPVSPKVQFTSSTGAPLANGTVTVYLAGTTTLTDTWQDKALTTLNTNPITLDSRGEALMWLDDTLTYKFLLKNSAGVTQWTVDNIHGGAPANSSGISFIQAGAGAVTRTMQAKGRDFFNVADYGITTAAAASANTTAMQALIDHVSSAGGGDIAAGAGTYNFLQLKPKNGVRILGYIGKTIFKLDNSAASGDDLFEHNTDGLDGSLDDFALDGVILDGNDKDACFVAFGCNRLRFTDVIFRNAGTYGCALQARPGFTITLAQDDIVFTRCQFNDNGSDAPGWDGLDIKWCTNTKLIACSATGNTDVGINVRGRNVDLIGCAATGNATAGILLQSNDSTENSFIRVIGGGATTTTAGPGLEIQGNTALETHVMVHGFQSYSNTGPGVRISGSGKVYGKIDVEARANTTHGVHITGDYVGRLLMTGLLIGNTVDGVNTAGQNTTFDMTIVGNSGTGYREEAGANNNYLTTSCVIDTNTVADIGTRVGAETADGFLSGRTKQSIRVFPGLSSGMELQTDSGGTHSSLVSVGDAASIDLRLITKGNGDVNLYKDNGSRQIGAFREAGSATVNYPDFVSSLTGAAVQFRASGSDTNIDLSLLPKGTGVVQFGGYTVNADAPVVGYVTIKDSGGTVRKLAVIA